MPDLNSFFPVCALVLSPRRPLSSPTFLDVVVRTQPARKVLAASCIQPLLTCAFSSIAAAYLPKLMREHWYQMEHLYDKAVAKVVVRHTYGENDCLTLTGIP